MKKSTRQLLSGVTAAVIGLSAVSAADIALLSSAVRAFAEETTSVAIDATNFPDENFRNYVLENIDIDGNGYLSESEIKTINNLFVEEMNIADLKGVEYFTALTFLPCGYNNLTTLDVSNNTALESLLCHENNLTELDLSKNTTLKTLLCQSNNLTTLDVSKNTALGALYCDHNNLTTLDVSNNTALEQLNCAKTNLTMLDVSKNTALKDFHCVICQYTLTTASLDELTENGFDASKASNWTGAE